LTFISEQLLSSINLLTLVVSRHTLFEELDKTQDEKDVEGRGKEEGVRRGFEGVATDRLQH
jgi:hypothetical protein